MSLTASSLLARLEELKKWQEKQQERLSQQQLTRAETSGTSSNYDTIEGLSEFNSSSDTTKNIFPDSADGILTEKNTNVHINRKTSPVINNSSFQNDISDNILSKTLNFNGVHTNKKTSAVINRSVFNKEFSDEVGLKSVKFNDENAPVKQKKKPFLKRGSGLVKYKMNPGDQKRPFNKLITRKSNLKNVSSMKVDNKSITNRKVDYEITPLKKPDLSVKAVWFKVQTDDDELKHNKDNKMYDANVFGKKVILPINELATENIDVPINKPSSLIDINSRELIIFSPIQEATSKEDETSPIKRKTIDFEQLGQHTTNNIVMEETLAKQTILQINEIIAQKIDVPINRQLLLSYENKSEEPKISSPMARNDDKVAERGNPSEQSLYEKQLEKELLIFEALEEKALNSSFSSTNSSILRILSSTPSKIKNKNVESKLTQGVVENKRCIEDYILEEHQDHNFVYKQTEENVSNQEKNVGNVGSLNSSVTSEDFETKSVNKEDYKDDTPWSDINILTRENSNLSSISVTTSGSSQREDTLVSEPIENNISNKSNENDDSKDLLAKKLKELDNEIQNFRRENAKLQKEKFEMEKQKREFKKEKKTFEKYVLEEKINVEFYLEDEKKKLAKEKMVFERYVKDVQSKTTRKEREEISSLKEEIANLKEAAKLKDTRNATSQARLRNQIKSFEKEIFALKEESEKLRKQNAKLTTSQKFNKKSSETKMLHEINRNLSKLTQDVKVSDQIKKMEESAEKTKLLSDALEIEENVRKKSLDKEDNYNSFYGKDKSDLKCNTERNQTDKNSDAHMSYDIFLKDKQREDCNVNSGKTKYVSDNQSNTECLRNITNISLERNYEMVFGNNSKEEMENSNIKENSKLINEIILTDGTKMFSYPNGNVKTISSDGNYITMKYFNGDIKETQLLEGICRYFYAENDCWQTTMADGTEILEFSSGQTEKKFKDGSTEIKFPNGIVRLVNRDGSESVSYPDSTKVDIDVRGQKTIFLPNGQKEIHNSEHMRREYPDGSVKIVYPDGMQETRYSNGRLRVKDKDGRLLMDSFDNTT